MGTFPGSCIKVRQCLKTSFVIKGLRTVKAAFKGSLGVRTCELHVYPEPNFIANQCTNVLMPRWCWSSRLHEPQHTVCIIMTAIILRCMQAGRLFLDACKQAGQQHQPSCSLGRAVGVSLYTEDLVVQ